MSLFSSTIREKQTFRLSSDARATRAARLHVTLTHTLARSSVSPRIIDDVTLCCWLLRYDFGRLYNNV